MEQTITVTEGLVKLKLLDKRIEKATEDMSLVTMTQGNQDKIDATGKDLKDFRKNAKAKLQSVSDLISQRNTIKSAIVLSNATTTVLIDNQPYTVADAIERKNSIKYDQSLLKKLKSQYANLDHQIMAYNLKVEQNLLALLKSRPTSTAEDDEKLSKTFQELNTYKLYDPLNLQSRIEKLETDISTFLADVDVALSVVNATTEITMIC